MASGYEEVERSWDIIMVAMANEWLDAIAEERERLAAEQESRAHSGR